MTHIITILNYKYEQHVLKASEGGPGVATLKSAFKSFNKKPGAAVFFFTSPYVGHTAFRIATDSQAKLKEALKILKNYRYIDSIKQGLKGSLWIG